MLVSEKNYVKVHKNQCVGSCHIFTKALLGSPAGGKREPPEAQKPSQGPDLGELHTDGDLQLLENKALSRGTIRKSTCLLATITIRKSQTGTFLTQLLQQTTHAEDGVALHIGGKDDDIIAHTLQTTGQAYHGQDFTPGGSEGSPEAKKYVEPQCHGQ